MENELSLKVEKPAMSPRLILNRPKQRNTMTIDFFRRCSGFSGHLMKTLTCGSSSSGRRGKALPPD